MKTLRVVVWIATLWGALLGFAFLSDASAGSVSLSITTASGTQVASATLSDADIARIAAAHPTPAAGDTTATAFLKLFLAEAISTVKIVEQQRAVTNLAPPAPVCASVAGATLTCPPVGP